MELYTYLQSKAGMCNLYLKYITYGRWEEKTVGYKSIKPCEDYVFTVQKVCKDLLQKEESLHNDVFKATVNTNRKEANINSDHRGEVMEFHAKLFPNKKDILISYGIKGKEHKMFVILINPHRF